MPDHTTERHTKAAVDDMNRAFVGDLGFAVFGIGGGQHAGAAFDVDRTFINDGGCVACTCVRNHAFGGLVVGLFAVVVGVDVDDGTFGIYVDRAVEEVLEKAWFSVRCQ